MAISKKSLGIGLGVMAVLIGGVVAGGIALNSHLSSLYDVDVDSEQQKVLLIGTWKEVDDYQPTVDVAIIPTSGKSAFKTITPVIMNYNTSGQANELSCWIDLSSWFQEVVGDVRIDDWCADGGRIAFQSSIAGVTSSTKTVDFGGGAYFVDVPSRDGEEPTVIYNTVLLQIPEVDVK